MKIASQINSALALATNSLVSLAAACAVLAAISMLPGPAFAQQAPQPSRTTQDDPVRATLSQFGSFVSHPKYGEVWTPTVTPPDWHPYAPCNWVNSKLGWYYDDTTDWGAIVHHYGRWTHDVQLGWIWIPGGEFSPGWVVWRTSQQWIGWAPMPPDEDLQTVSADAFNKGDSWIFQDVPAFERGCSGPAQVAPQDHIVPLLAATTFVTEIDIIDGIAIYVLPPFIGGPVIDIIFDFQPWAPAFFAQVMIDWNWMWNNLNAPGAPCAPGKQAGAGGNPPPGGGNPPPGGGGPPPGGGGGFATCPDGSLLPANGLCPIKVVATCANGLLPLIQCKNNPIVCGAGLHALGNTCVANVVCTPPAKPDSSGIGCVSPDPPTKVAGGGCNGPNGAYAGCSGGGSVGPGGGGGKPPGGSGCAVGSTLEGGIFCTPDSPIYPGTCNMAQTYYGACVGNNVTCGAPGMKPCGPGMPTPFHCVDGTWQYACNLAGGVWVTCGAGQHAAGNGKTCLANAVCAPPLKTTSDGTGCWSADDPGIVIGSSCKHNYGPNGPTPGCISASYTGCGLGSILDENGHCKGGPGTKTVNDQNCDMKITAAKVCVAPDVTCGAPGLMPCLAGHDPPEQCADGTYRSTCPLAKVNLCGPMKHVDGTNGAFKCVADVTCTPPATVSLDGKSCVLPMADVQGPRPTSSPSPSSTTTIAPTCCAIIHPTYGHPLFVGTPTPRPTMAATGTPLPVATNRPVTTMTATPTPIATYRPPPREPLPPAIVEKAKPDIGREPARPIEVISHGGGGMNTYAAKPIVTSNTHPAAAMSNSAPQPYRAPPTAFVHAMPAPAPAVARKPAFKP
jgi:hypothetical protein